MGGRRRYYCHYCHVSFPYSTEGRKRHCSGLNHSKARTQYYRQFDSARQRYNTEVTREKCRRFASPAGCTYGDDCIYSHGTQEELDKLQKMAKMEGLLEEYGFLPSQVTAAVPEDDAALTRLLVQMRWESLCAKYPSLRWDVDSGLLDNTINKCGRDFSLPNTSIPPPPPQSSADGLVAPSSAVSWHSLNPELLPPSLRRCTMDQVLAQSLPEWG